MLRILATAVVAVVALAAPALATDRFYLDSFAVSANGCFRIDAKSPDNAGPHPKPFAANFTYTLTDTTTNQVIWERKQPMTREKGGTSSWSKEGSPKCVFVNDDRVVVAWLSTQALLILDSADGHKRAAPDILDAFPSEEKDKYVARTTGGPMWSQNSEWYFLTIPASKEVSGGTYFAIRPFWNHRLIFNLASGQRVPLGSRADAASLSHIKGADAPTARLLSAAIDEETRRALAALANAPEWYQSKNYEQLGWVRAALHTVGFLRLYEAEPQLRALEASVDPVADAGMRYLPLIREAIRRIGRVPSPGCGVLLYPSIESGNNLSTDTEHPYKAFVSLEDRLTNAGKIASGMTTRELTDLIGCPDAVMFGREHRYDYDIDAPTPYTLRVIMVVGAQSVARIDRITPPTYLHDAERMRRY